MLAATKFLIIYMFQFKKKMEMSRVQCKDNIVDQQIVIPEHNCHSEMKH